MRIGEKAGCKEVSVRMCKEVRRESKEVSVRK